MDTYSVVLAGDVDLACAEELHAASRGFQESTHPDVAVDLSQVTFMDSTGLSLLLRLHDTAHQRGGTVTLIRPGHQCSRLLEISKLSALFEYRHATRPTAMVQ